MSVATIQPPDFMPSEYAPEPRPRVASLPGFVSLGIEELFPEIPKAIYGGDEGDLSVVRRAAETRLARVDMSRIERGDTVNINASEHGFGILGGRPYVEMIKAIRDIVVERTGCKAQLRLAMYRGHKEAEEVEHFFELGEYFDGHVKGLLPFDKGVAIETRIGTLYGVARAYDAKHFIHAYYDDPREMYFNRLLYKSLKSFTMSYARLETRSVYHANFGNRSSNVVPRAIFDSDFIQKRYAFSCVLRTSPHGVIDVDASNDLYEIDRKITVDHLQSYGKMQRLFGEVADCIAVWDGGRWGYYLHAGGVIFGVLLTGRRDAFDLSVPATASWFQVPGSPGANDYLTNPAIRAIVVNQAWVGAGIPYGPLPMLSPTFVVGEEQAELWRRDASNPIFPEVMNVRPTIEDALDAAKETAGTDKMMVFDGSYGHLTVSPSMAEFLKSRAEPVRRRVEDELLPLWLKQRGLEGYQP